MSDIATLKSYLVDLGFNVNQSQYNKFTSTLKESALAVTKEVEGIAGSLIKWQTSIIGMFAAVSGAVIGTMDKVAMADQEYRLFGERMFMDTEHARSMKIALDALGVSLEDVAFDDELNKRYLQLQKDQADMAHALGPDFEKNMKSIRDVDFELNRLKVEFKFFTFAATNDIFKALNLGSGTFLENLQSINKQIRDHLPEISQKFTDFIIPVLKDTYHIGQDIVRMLGEIALAFTNTVGIFSGHKELEGTTLDFHKFADSVKITTDFVAHLVDILLKLELVLVRVATKVENSAIGKAALHATEKFFEQYNDPKSKLNQFDTFKGIHRFFDFDNKAPLTNNPNEPVPSVSDIFSAPKNVISGAASGITSLNDPFIDKLANSIMKVESNGQQFDKNGNTLTSSAGALGLMQLMPDTAKQLGVNPNNAADNFKGGELLLQQLLKHFNDNLEAVIAAYNWGQGNVDSFIKTGHGLKTKSNPKGVFPQETKNYIDRVESNMGLSPTFHIYQQPGESSDALANRIMDKMSEQQGKETQRNLAMIQSPF